MKTMKVVCSAVLWSAALLLATEAFTSRSPVISRLQTSRHLEKPSFLADIPNPFSRLTGGETSESKDSAYERSINSQSYDGTTEAGLINQAKRLLQSDLGLSDPSLLDDARFAWLGPTVDAPLSKTDYIAAGRFFNLRGAFPDLDFRAHDFRLDQVDGNTVRCTCRVTGTMRGELRLRTGVLAPTGVTMRCPPEAVSMTFDKATGKVTKLCTGFALDRLVGNTQGTTGVQAASTVAGESVSVWELFPPATVLGNVFARPTKPIPETTTFLAPFPETVMVQLAKGVISAAMASDDPTLLSDGFTFCTPTVGPIRKSAYLEKYAAQELSSCEPNFSNFRIDPYDPVRVWADLLPTGPGFQGPPQAMSFSFDEDGYCTRITSWAVMDPSIGNAGGLGGQEGFKYATGQASAGFFTRPLPRALGRLRMRLLSPITGVAVDAFKPVAGKAPPAAVFKASAAARAPTAIPKPPTPVRAVTPSKPPVERSAPPKSEPPTDDNIVLKRLESLKEFTSSIRIIPSSISKSVPITPPSSDDKAKEREKRLAAAQQATEKANQAIEKAKRDSAAIAQQQVTEKAKQQAAADSERKRIADASALREQKQAQQEALARKQREAEQAREAEEARKQQLAQQAEADRQRKEAERQKVADAAAKQAEAERSRRELVARKAEAERQKAIDAKQREQEAEERRAAAAAAAEAKRAQAAAAAEARQAEIEQAKREAEAKRAQAAAAAEARRAEIEQAKREAEAEQKRAAAAEARQAEIEQAKREAEQKRAAAAAAAKRAEVERERAAAAAEREAEAELKKREAEAQRAAAMAAAETRKVQVAREQLAEQKRREAAANAKLSQVASNAAERQKSPAQPKKVAPTARASSSSEQATENSQALAGLAQAASRATVALFGLGKRDLEELPPAASKAPSSSSSSSTKRAPLGVPTVSRWRQNADKTITGLVSGSRNFDEGSRITTSPITSGIVASGEVVRTGSGSRYFLD